MPSRLRGSLSHTLRRPSMKDVYKRQFVVYWSGKKDADELDEALAAFLQDWRENQQLLSFGQDITLSIGAAQYPQDGDCYEAVWEKADEALYKAKKSGGDQVGHAPSFGPA